MNVTMVAPYPRTRDAHGEESLGGVASYTKNLVDGLRAHASVRVLAPGNGQPGTRADGDVAITDVPREGPALPRALRALGEDPSVDAVHVQFEQHLFGGMRQNLRLALALRRLRAKKRVVVTLHQVPDLRAVDRDFLRRNGFPPFPILARLWMRLQYALLAAASHLLLVHEPGLKERLVAQYGLAGAQVAVVPHGVETGALPCPQPEAKARLGAQDKVLLLYFGYVTGYKGVDLLVDALERLPAATRERLRVVVAGKVPERKLENAAFRADAERLEARIQALGAWVERKGFLTPEEIALHLAAADAAVFPYRQVFGASGPFAITLGHGRPFLVSDAFAGMGMPEAATFPRDPDALAAKIVRCVEDPALLAGLASEARRMAGEASWPRVAERTAALYEPAPRVLLMGAYGQDNLGDETLLEVHLQRLASMRLTVASTNPAQTAQRYGVDAVPTYGLRRAGAAFAASDAVVYGGGSVVKELPSPHPRYRVVASLALLSTIARALGRKVVYSAVGVERLPTRLGRALARRAARAASLLHVRDEGSRSLVAAVGGGSARVVADPAFLLRDDARAGARADDILAPARGRPVVVLNPMWSHEVEAPREIVVGSFAALADEVRAKLGAHVVLLPFKTSGEESELSLAADICARLADPSGATVAPADLRPAEALALMRRSAFVVGMRHHGALLGIVSGAPVLAVPYAPKTRHLVEEFRMEGSSLAAADLAPGTLVAAFWRAYGSREQQGVVVRKALVEAQARAEENFTRIHAALAGSA